jgi:hypothetical protein
MKSEVSEVSEVDVTVGDGVVIVKRKGSTGTAVANILGSEEVDNTKRIYVDRLIHKPYESTMGAFNVSGAISTILTQPMM